MQDDQYVCMYYWSQRHDALIKEMCWFCDGSFSLLPTAKCVLCIAGDVLICNGFLFIKMLYACQLLWLFDYSVLVIIWNMLVQTILLVSFILSFLEMNSVVFIIFLISQSKDGQLLNWVMIISTMHLINWMVWWPF
jgi:hypothetical protein